MQFIDRPDKKGWAVLSQDPPVDISIDRYIYSPVKCFTQSYIHTCCSFELQCEKKSINDDTRKRITSQDICAEIMFEI